MKSSGKVEKQASSEIAQSRERFEKKWADDYFDGIFPITWDSNEEAYTQAEVQNSWLSWQAAERDTRERLAQQQQENVTDLINLAGAIVRRNYLPSLERCRTILDARFEVERYDSRHVDLAMRIKAVAERIRGKE